ncbi:MAG TPA: sulfatase-like hydrolase/transferase [Gemmatimonadales bacterium]|nr:sulfatase-like hydrolase/transferase [Gemmatimonadales bacterium]
MTAPRSPGSSHHLSIAFRLAGLAWLAMAVQEALLFLRPNPFGEPYVGFWKPYLAYALIYNLFGVAVVSAPAVLFWLLRDVRSATPRTASRVHYAQLAALTATVVLDHLDNEVMRFMGIHLRIGLVRTYFRVQAWGDDMGHIILGDRGGPGLPFLILIVMPVAVWWLGRRIIRSRPLRFALPLPASLAITAVPLALFLFVTFVKPPGGSRRLRIRPEVMTLYSEVKENMLGAARPSDLPALAKDYQAAWYSRSGDSAWRFVDPERPLVRAPVVPAAPKEQDRWNVIFLQLETFRGWNTGHLNPDSLPSPTPFLDRFAKDSASAYWRRHMSFGPPTVSGFIAAHCSVKPHSVASIVASFTYTALDCLPTVLRRYGYRTELFTGTDPDWDNQTIWIRRWYDAYHYYSDTKNIDRPAFRRAAERIKALGRSGQPFMATVISVSNHLPFRARRMGPGEERFDVYPDHPPWMAIRNTIHYTDDVVGEFIGSLQNEPWFAHTIVVITGDHGYDLGERGTATQGSGWREATWVPLVIHGAHPRLRKGAHEEPASLLDIAPTVAHLLGIRETNPWMGSSLVEPGHTGSPFASGRGTGIFGESGRWSLVVYPNTGRPGLYDWNEDPLQRHDLADQHRPVVDSIERQATRERLLLDYLIEANRVWQAAVTPPAPEPAAAGP